MYPQKKVPLLIENVVGILLKIKLKGSFFTDTLYLKRSDFCRSKYEKFNLSAGPEADLRYVEHLCRRAKNALNLVFLR